MPNIIIADPHGFCFGVDRAVKLAQDSAKKFKQAIFLLGELVHNQHVIDWLESELKIKTVTSLNEIPDDSVVIIRAHGATPQTFKEAKDRGLIVIDATCPLVAKSHQIALDLIQKNQRIIFLCSSLTHDETVGIVGESPEFITPLTLKDALDFEIKNSENYTVLTQTTLSSIETKEVLDNLKSKYPELNITPHICAATTERQNAIIDLAKKYKFVIIVGAPTSANSNNLRQVAESVGAIAYIVDTAADLKSEWFNDQKNIVVSSGASTPESVLNDVINRVKEITHQ